jgi:ubiquinone/menaquinone biosynthesis C-methylase UbiE
MVFPNQARAARVAASKETVRQGWVGRVHARGKWHAKNVIHTRALTTAILEAAGIRPGMNVLDVAAGTGDPAIALARLVGTRGHVTVTDLVSEMLEAAEGEAKRYKLTNVSFKQADAESLPFDDNCFDAVTCRLGIMFFPHPVQALREMRRILKPGGRAALVTWGPPARNLRTTTTLAVLRKFLERQASQRNFRKSDGNRFAFAGTLAEALGEAGFRKPWAESRTVQIPWPGSPEDCWERVRDASGGAQLLGQIAEEDRAEAVRKVLTALAVYHDGKQVSLQVDIVVGSGIS